MGWKAFNLIATARNDGYLTTFPPPRPARARQVLALLGGTYESSGDATFETALYPRRADDLYVGAYDDAIVLGSQTVAEEAFTGVVPRAVVAASAMMPGCRVLIAMLHSVVNLYGYAWYEQGTLLRARAGNAEDGIVYDRGEPLEVERQLRAFDDSIDGEELVMELCRPFLGCRIDEYDAWDLKMEWFRRTD